MSIGITLPSTPLYSLLAERILARRENSQYAYQKLEGELHPIEWMNLHKPEGFWYVGPDHLTDMRRKIKYLYQWPYTKGEIALEYLHLITDGKELRRPNGPDENIPAPPVYFTGPRYDHCAYVDISGCYFNLYRPLCLDLLYKSNHGNLETQAWYVPGKTPFLYADELGLDKQVRNTVFGIMRKSGQTQYLDGVYKRTKGKTNFFRYCLVKLVMETLQAVANDCISMFPVHMWLTDAAILPYRHAQALMDYLNLEWGLQSRIVAQGQSRLLAFGRYDVGGKQSKNIAGRPIAIGKDTLRSVDVQYLKHLRRETLDLPVR